MCIRDRVETRATGSECHDAVFSDGNAALEAWSVTSGGSGLVMSRSGSAIALVSPLNNCKPMVSVQCVPQGRNIFVGHESVQVQQISRSVRSSLSAVLEISCRLVEF